MPALVVEKLGFDLGPRKLVVFRTDRRDLPHLTLSWNNSSGELDLHLTPANPKNADDRDSIGRIRQADLEEIATTLGQRLSDTISSKLLKLFQPISPVWLRRNYYKVLQPNGEPLDQWLLRAFPKSRGKYRANPKLLRPMPKSSLRHPTTERLTELRTQRQVWAVCTAGWKKNQILVLHYLEWRNRGPVWVAIDYDDAQEFNDLFSDFFPTEMEILFASKFKQIYTALRLNEMGW